MMKQSNKNALANTIHESDLADELALTLDACKKIVKILEPELNRIFMEVVQQVRDDERSKHAWEEYSDRQGGC